MNQRHRLLVLDWLFRFHDGKVSHPLVPIGAKIWDVSCKEVSYDADHALVRGEVTWTFEGIFSASQFEEIITLN